MHAQLAGYVCLATNEKVSDLGGRKDRYSSTYNLDHQISSIQMVSKHIDCSSMFAPIPQEDYNPNGCLWSSFIEDDRAICQHFLNHMNQWGPVNVA